jgi:hypothetical protein
LVIAQEVDEGTAAHIFQLLMVAQLPIIVFFAVKWLPQQPRRAAQVIGLQVIAGLGAIIAVYYLT